MRKTLFLVAVASFLVPAVPLFAREHKPLVVLSLSSHDAAKSATESINCVKDMQKLPTWLSSLLALYAQGQEVSGLDKSRPWGAVVQYGEKVAAYGFLPITSIDALASELSGYISSTTDLGDGTYHVLGTEAGKELYAKQSGDWLFVSDSAENLADVPADPTKLLDGLHKKFEIGVRLALKNVPARVGNEILDHLDKLFGTVLRQKTSSEEVELLGKVAFALDEVTLGWAKR